MDLNRIPATDLTVQGPLQERFGGAASAYGLLHIRDGQVAEVPTYSEQTDFQCYI